MGQIEQWQAQLRNAASVSVMEAQYHVTTPMFIGDGEYTTRDVRPPSIKGALRFWWRALNWGTVLKQHGNINAALQALHAQEATLFGLAARDSQGGQGLFTLNVTQAPIPADPPMWQPGQGTQYLLGQGLWHFRDKLLRRFIPAGHVFSVTATARGTVTTNREHQALWNSLEDALLALGMWGGLGSRARRGLGSVSIHALHGGQHSAPTTLEDYRTQARRLLECHAENADLPPFSAVSRHTRFSFSGLDTHAHSLLETMGSEMQLYRSWGNKGHVGGRQAECNFSEDHDTVLKAAQGARLDTPPKRIVFGLPHNYFFSSLKQGNKIVEISVKKDAAGERRASPLIMHVHQLPSGHCLAAQLLLPAVFLPGRHPQLQYKHGRTSYLDCPETQIDWQVIHDFMDRFKDWHTLGSTAYRKPSGAA